MSNRPGELAVVFAALLAAHQIGDHWVQTHAQACAKGQPGPAGRRACAAHVATYTATALATLALTTHRTGLSLRPARLAAGLAFSAVTHWVIDRRRPLRALADRLGKRDFAELAGGGMNGMYLLDQSAHVGCLLAAALLITPGPSRTAGGR